MAADSFSLRGRTALNNQNNKKKIGLSSIRAIRLMFLLRKLKGGCDKMLLTNDMTK